MFEPIENQFSPEMSDEDRAMFEKDSEEPDDQDFEDEHIKTSAGFPSDDEVSEEEEHQEEL